MPAPLSTIAPPLPGPGRKSRAGRGLRGTRHWLITALWLGFALLASLSTEAGNRVRWTFRADNAIYSSPALGKNGLLYVGSDDGIVYALDAATGGWRWQFPTGDVVSSSPAIGPDGTVYVGSLNGRVYALNGTTGAKLWDFLVGDWLRSSPAIGRDGLICIGSHDKQLYGLDAANGQLRWKGSTDGFIESSPAIAPNGLVYAGSYDQSLYAFDAASGERRWQFSTDGLIESSPAIGEGGVVYVGSWDGRIYAINGDTGTKLWSYACNGIVEASPVLMPGNTLIIGAWDGVVYALESTTGIARWKFQTDGLISSAATVAADGTIYLGAWDGIMYALDGATGEDLWQFRTGGAIRSAPALGPDGALYFGSENHTLYCLEGNAPVGLANSWWPRFHGDAQNTGRVGTEPRLLNAPRSAVTWEGLATEWTVGVDGRPTPVIQWYLNGSPIAGATNLTYRIPAAARSDDGTYDIVATNQLGRASATAALRVSNVATSDFRGVIVTAPAATSLSVQATDALPPGSTWTWLADLTLTTRPERVIDWAASGASQRLYRTTRPAHLEVWALPGVPFIAPAGSRHRIDFTDASLACDRWQTLTNLTLPTSPYLFLDPPTAGRPPRFYRTTPLP